VYFEGDDEQGNFSRESQASRLECEKQAVQESLIARISVLDPVSETSVCFGEIDV